MGCTMAGWAVRVTALLLLTGLAGCAGGPDTADRAVAPAQAKATAKASTGRVQRIAYAAPGADAPLAPSLDTSQTAWDIEQQIAANVGAIADASLGSSRAGSVMTVLYSGDPRDYIDCGRISMWVAEGDTPKSMKGAEDKLQLARTTRKPDGRLERKLRLDSRTTVRFSQLPGGSTRVDARTRYVLTKEVNNFAFGGGKDGKDKWLGVTRETIAFNTGERGSFSVGTTCVATGRLEQAILAGVGSVPLSVAAPAGT
jgi:hypothetical protein